LAILIVADSDKLLILLLSALMFFVLNAANI